MISKIELFHQISTITFVTCLLTAPFAFAAEKTHQLPNIATRVKTLDKQLEKDAIKMDKHDIAAMTKAETDLAAALPNPGLQVGSIAPNFTLNNPNGTAVELKNKLRKGPVILVFYRGAWCPYCNLELKALKESLPKFEKYGASLIAVTPQTPDKSLEQIKQDGYPFEILSDLDNQVIKAYKLYWEVSDELDAAYKHSFGLDITAFNGNGRRGLPIPGTFVIDQSGTIRAAFADIDYKKRMEPADILAALKRLPQTK